MLQKETSDQDNNKIKPVSLRWRVVGGELVLRQRHMRSLQPLNLPAPLHAWVHERLDWAKDNLLDKNTDGVLCLNIDPATEIVVSLEDVRERPSLSIDDIKTASNGGVYVQDYAGTIWLEKDGKLITTVPELVSAVDTLVRDLAQTQGVLVEYQNWNDLSCDREEAVLFLISDEFGLVPISASSELVQKFAKQVGRVIF